jgi:hypothetical protein
MPSSLEGQVIHCLPCTVDALRDRDKQLAAGAPMEEVKVIPPNPAFTWSFTLINGVPVVLPYCTDHLGYKEQSVLAQ